MNHLSSSERPAHSPDLVEVAVLLPLRHSLTYRLPATVAPPPGVGLPVLVPVGRQRAIGFILGPAQEVPPVKIKPIFAALRSQPLFGPEEVPLYRWLAAYYHAPLGQVIETALPAWQLQPGQERWAAATAPGPEGVKRLPGPKGREILAYLREHGPMAVHQLAQRFSYAWPALKRLAAAGWVRLEERPVRVDPWLAESGTEPSPPPSLSPEQEEAVAAVGAALERGGFAPFLLHGVTASGKTEVYLQSAALALARERSVLVLLPEIALTHPIGLAFRQRFGDQVTLWHSGLTPQQRLRLWQQIRQGQLRVVVGARSAVFVPLPDLGLIVVDEEHDPSYKNEGGLPYQGRDVALYRGYLSGAAVILGSATPAITTYYRAQQGKIRYLRLPHRVTPQAQPEIHLLNLKDYREGRRLPVLAAPLRLALADTLARGEQALLFLNRRGYANIYFCLFCGHVFQCRQCSVSLTVHQQQQRLLCHYCGYSTPIPEICPQCGSAALKRYGLGTERLEKELRQLFPAARIARLDRDVVTHPTKAIKILTALKNQELDILIGTQMITKGHDLPQVTLVGVVAADLGLYFPEYHAGERTFQLLTQVAGRAGRGERPGRVLIQTFHPQHPAIATVKNLDYEEFYRQELAQRQAAGYPPFSRLALLRLSSPDSQTAEDGAWQLHRLLRQVRDRQGLQGRIQILGPAPAPRAKLRGEYRWQLLLKSSGRQPLATLLEAAVSWRRRPHHLQLFIDVDPDQLL